MKMALLRVGIDAGAGGMQGPLFTDGSFELVPIPDNKGVATRTYGNTLGTKGKPLLSYFPVGRQAAMADQSMHLDPEFQTFTYGDPTPPKAGLRKLDAGDVLVFYAGLQGWDHTSTPALYLVGYFVVKWAGMATELADEELRRRFGNNFHVAHDEVLQEQRNRLVLVQGGHGSRLLERAYCISFMSQDKSGQPLKVLSAEAREIFGDFGGKVSIQRSPTRWVAAEHVRSAMKFLERLA